MPMYAKSHSAAHDIRAPALFLIISHYIPPTMLSPPFQHPTVLFHIIL